MHDLFSCDHCEKTYLTKSRLKQHVQQNHFNSAFKKQPSKKFFCKLCHKKVLFLKFHLNTFHSNRTFDCDLCSFSTKYSANLKIHKDSVRKILIFDYFQCFLNDFHNFRSIRLKSFTTALSARKYSTTKVTGTAMSENSTVKTASKSSTNVTFVQMFHFHVQTI